MTPIQAEALRVWREVGSYAEAARRLGKDESAIRKNVRKALAAEDEPEGVSEALERLRVQGAQAAWIKSKDASVYWRRPEPEADPLAFLDAIKAGLADVPRASDMGNPISGPSDLIAVFPVADLHMGLLTDAEETGADWDSKIASRVFADAFARLVRVSPEAGTAILANLGDATHTDDQRNVTPGHGHQLDADSRFFVILRRTVAAMKGAIEALRAKYPRVIYRGSRGNHDIHSHYAVTLALAEHYRNVPGVEIVEAASEFYVREFGRNLIVLHHGDRAKPERLAHYIAAEFPEQWGRTRHRIALSGHIHHARAQEVGGLVCESIGTIIPRDAYAASHAYSARRGLVSLCLHREEGEVSRARVGVA